MNCGSLRATRRVAAQVSEVADRCASSRIPTAAAETQAKLQADCGGGGRVQRRRWRRKICGHKVPESCTPQIEGTSGVTATERVPVACTPRIGCTSGMTATELQCSGVTTTETECSGVTATGEVRW